MSLHPMPATRAEWLANRTRYVGASEVAALFGVQADYALSHWALWHVKAGRAEPPPVESKRVAWGLKLEEVVAMAAAEEQGWTVHRGRYAICDDTPGMAASLDFEVLEGDPAGPGVLETKNVDWLVHRRTWTDGEPPQHIVAQLQHQLACTGYAWGAVAALVGGNDLHVYRYEARPKLIADIKRLVAAFWRSIRENKPPPVDGSAGASAVLRSLYPETIDDEVDLTADNELPAVCADLLAAAERRKEAEKAESEAKNRVREKIGPYRRAIVQGFRISVAVTAEKPDRPAEPGEIIKGRAEVRRISIKEIAA